MRLQCTMDDLERARRIERESLFWSLLVDIDRIGWRITKRAMMLNEGWMYVEESPQAADIPFVGPYGTRYGIADGEPDVKIW